MALPPGSSAGYVRPVVQACPVRRESTAVGLHLIKVVPKLTILSAAELATGWTGKLWALEAAVSSAAASGPDYFWFTDADIVHAPDTLRRLVARAQTNKLDLTSLMVVLNVESFAERLLIPPFLYFFLMLYPPKWTSNRKARTAGAAGGCILLRRTALERIGGLSTIRGEIIDDCA